MGIRFYCPNGHKLNVKDFQAGQIGICPFCGAKSPIPLESTRPSSAQEQASQRGGTAKTVFADSEAEQSLVIAPPTAAPAVASIGLVDPLAGETEVAWYIRPPSGGQFGPAVTSVMRTRLGEGRITADSLVWREGWQDWQAAADVFPQLSPNQPIARPEATPSEPIVVPIHPHSAPIRRHKSVWSNRPVLIGSMVLIIVVLVIVLLVILLKQ